MRTVPLKIGYIPTRRKVFSAVEAKRYSVIILDQIREFDIEIVDMEGINEEGLLFRQEDVMRVVDRMRQGKVDALFFPHCNFGSEGLVAQVAAALSLPTLLYGPRDDAPDADGMRYRDSQCGLFATGKDLLRRNVPFSYISNVAPDSAAFRVGFDKFLRVTAVVNALRNIRLLQFGPRPDDFLSVIINEGELAEKFGVEIFPVPLPDLVQCANDIRAKNTETFQTTCEQIKRAYQVITERPDEQVCAIASLKLAIASFATKYRANCAAIYCWDAFLRTMGIFPCAVNSMLADEGFPCACETDIHGAISAMILQAATGNREAHFFADITNRHPLDNNIELLWHCGPFPASLAKNKSDCKITNAWIGGDPTCGNCGFELRHGPITVCRFDGDHGNYSLFIGEGEGVDGPTELGNYVWLKVDDWNKWEHQLVHGPYVHHIVGTYGNLGDVLHEACRYFPALQSDPVSPNAETLEKRWRDSIVKDG